MKKFLLVLMTALPAFAGISSGAKYKLNNQMGRAANEAQLGTIVAEGGERGSTVTGHMPQQLLVGEYDYSTLGGASLATIELGVSLPDKAIIVQSYLDVITALAGTGASVSISAANGVGNPENVLSGTVLGSLGVGQVAGVSTGAASAFRKVSGESGIRVRINGSALTAGKFKVYLQYVIGE